MCERCGHLFVVPNFDSWAYKDKKHVKPGKTTMFCSWRCLDYYRRELDKTKKKPRPTWEREDEVSEQEED